MKRSGCPGDTGQREAKAELDAAEGRPVGEFDPVAHFLHDVPAEILATAAAPLDEADVIFASPSMLQRQPAVATHVVVGRDDRFFPAEFQVRVARERLDIDADVTPGGHLVALSRPVELADLLSSYV